MRVIWALPIIVSILLFTLVLSQNTEALKSQGNSASEIYSKKVCGISLCDEPMTIAEKIRLYMQQLSGSESTILQQAFDFRLMLEEPLSEKQLEQAKVRGVVPTTPQTGSSIQSSTGQGFQVVPTTPQIGSSIQSSTGRVITAPTTTPSLGFAPEVQQEVQLYLGPPISLPCENCITALFIAPDAVGAGQIASGAVIEGKIAPNAVRASEIAVRAVGASELDMTIKAFSVSNNGGTTNTKQVKMVPNNGKNFCFLVKVNMDNIDSGGETAECDIDYGNLSDWWLQAVLGEPNNDANVSCQAVCISYG